jgi:hypothetical protein
MNIYTIYKATCINTGKSYIGFDSHWPKRKSEHKTAAKRDTTSNKFYNAVKKYGWSAFIWEVIYQSTDYHHCISDMESFFIKEYDTLSAGYNSTTGGEGTGVGTRWWNNGENQIFVAFAPAVGYTLGRLSFNNRGAKVGADAQRGKFWVNNGITEFMTRESVDGYSPGRLSAFSGKQGQHTKGRHWWNNTLTECMSKLPPDSSFIRGRLFKA